MEKNEAQSGAKPILFKASEGNSALSVGISGFVYAMSLLLMVPAAAAAATAKILDNKQKFLTKFFEEMRSPVFGKWGLALDTAIATAYGITRYTVQARAKKEHDKLVHDNIAMRTQLNQTGQILRHVANEVGKGHIADSQLTMTEDAPPSHVARLEAQQAVEAAQAALSK